MIRKKVKYSYGYFPVLFEPEICGAGVRDKIYNKLREQNIFSRKYFYPITADAACFGDKYKKLNLDNARYAGDNILILPLYPEIEHEIIDAIVDMIQDII